MNRDRVLDFAERIVLAVFAGRFILSFTPSLSTHPYNWLLLIGELATLVFIMIRRPGAMAVGFYPVVVGFLGTLLPLLARPVANEVAPELLAGALMMIGIMTSVSAKLFLNRSFGIVAANRGTKRHGPYRLVRHPMYAGYILMQLGFLMLNFSVWNLGIYALTWAFQVFRIREEERFLMQDPAYRDYATAVRRRLIPFAY
nr:isoprenylcysteine carboxylmethyltransferase family protein [Polymorphobacter sp.]